MWILRFKKWIVQGETGHIILREIHWESLHAENTTLALSYEHLRAETIVVMGDNITDAGHVYIFFPGDQQQKLIWEKLWC